MPPNSAGFILLCQLLFSSFSCSEVFAWQQQSVNRRNYYREKDCGGSKSILSEESSFRREFFFQIARTASIAAITTTATTTLILPNSVAQAAVASAEDARSQWKKAVVTLDNLLKDWSTLATSGGDSIRGKLGTQGTTSPLFQIDKALKALRDSDYVDDFIEFQETADEFGLALSRADSMAYSANFAGGSGKPTPPAVYIEKSKVEVIEMQRIAKKLDNMVK